jgi:pimeloyl-ACP methyl ester carboxylesterase/GNAT superfamily N-acetyltransferase
VSVDPTIRAATATDADDVADVFLTSFHATYDFPLAHTDDEVRAWIRRDVIPSGRTWVATEGERVVGMMVVGPGDLEQLYVAPDRLGRGIGQALLDHAKRLSPAGLALATFQVNARARRFYERNGFVEDGRGDGSGNEEGQPDLRYVWRPAASSSVPDRVVTAPDGVAIAVFERGAGVGPPIVLVHGATADHTTWRTSGPLLAARHRLAEVDRRGRGESGDAPAGSAYSIELEYDDLATVAATVAAEHGSSVDVVGHSYGGRVALGAAVRSDAIRRVVCYEGAPPAPGAGYQAEDGGVLRRVEALVAAGDRDAALATFMREIVRMPEDELAAFRANPIWARRAAAVDTTIRELRAEVEPAAGLDALAAVRQPVLQILGGASAPAFGEATRALDARLRNGRDVTIDGARHAAHHTHAPAFVAAVEAFLADPDLAD